MIYFAIFILLCSPLFGSLKERFIHATAGDYMVTEQNKIFSLLRIHEVSTSHLILEEVSIPSHLLPAKTDWKQWMQKGALHHSSWIMYEVDFTTDQVIECYSFSQQAWLSTETLNAFLPHLLNLQLDILPVYKRKKIGPPPPFGEVDQRKIWSPPLIIDGQRIKKTQFEVLSGRWPKDGSELSNQILEIYFDAYRPSFPFPCWIHITDESATFKIRTVDSGNGMPSPHRTLPRRIPEFMSSIQVQGGYLRLSLKCPAYYRHFDLYAIEMNSPLPSSTPVPYDLKMSDQKELCYLDVPLKELGLLLQPHHVYTWILVPHNAPELFIELESSYIHH